MQLEKSHCTGPQHNVLTVIRTSWVSSKVWALCQSSAHEVWTYHFIFYARHRKTVTSQKRVHNQVDVSV